MKRLKVLVVEDDPSARAQLVKFVAKEGFEVGEAEDMSVAIEKVDSMRPDIVITDFRMPKGNGLEVIRYAKKTIPDLQAILVTAFGELDTAITALREGVIDYLKKPLDLDILATALGRAASKIAELKKLSPQPATILIVEDEASSAKLLAQTMEKEEWQVFTAGNGEEALKIFSEHKVDVVALDIRMPGKDGLSVLHEMRQIQKDFEAIIITGYGEEEHVLRALEAGAINFMKKPIDLNQFVIFVGKAFQELNLKRALRYRLRELALAQNVIARIVAAGGLIIDFLAGDKGLTLPALALKILDLVPMGLVLVSEGYEIRYANQPVAAAAKDHIQKFDELFVKDMEKLGIRELPFEKLKTAVEGLFQREEGAVENLKVGQWAYVTLIKVLLVQGDKSTHLVLLAMRGERS